MLYIPKRKTWRTRAAVQLELLRQNSWQKFVALQNADWYLIRFKIKAFIFKPKLDIFMLGLIYFIAYCALFLIPANAVLMGLNCVGIFLQQYIPEYQMLGLKIADASVIVEHEMRKLHGYVFEHIIVPPMFVLNLKIYSSVVWFAAFTLLNKLGINAKLILESEATHSIVTDDFQYLHKQFPALLQPKAQVEVTSILFSRRTYAVKALAEAANATGILRILNLNEQVPLFVEISVALSMLPHAVVCKILSNLDWQTFYKAETKLKIGGLKAFYSFDGEDLNKFMASQFYRRRKQATPLSDLAVAYDKYVQQTTAAFSNTASVVNAANVGVTRMTLP
jgi:hypothetical protein